MISEKDISLLTDFRTHWMNQMGGIVASSQPHTKKATKYGEGGLTHSSRFKNSLSNYHKKQMGVTHNSRHSEILDNIPTKKPQSLVSFIWESLSLIWDWRSEIKP